MSFMLLSALAWSLFDLARKKLTAHAQPLTLAIWLSAGVTPLYLLLWLSRGASLPEAGYWLPGLVSLLVSALASVCYIKALSVGRIALLVPVLSFTPVVAAVLSAGLLGERLSGVQLLAMLSIVLAIFLLHSGWNLLLRPKEAGAGLGLMLVVALCWGTGIVFDKMALTSATVFFHGLIQSAGMCLVLLLAYSVDSLRRRDRLSVPRYSGPWGLMALALLVFVLAVSGQWLVCQKPDVVKAHHSKVYGKAPIGAPPMSVPHLDTRIINGEPALLFGPFAGFTTRFLKQGSVFDLFGSVRATNLRPMLSVSKSNMDLTKYLIGEVFQSHTDRVESLRNFFPDAQEDDWALQMAGQRVQIIKQTAEGGGKLEFGTEIVAAKDGSLAALLGASPGASTAANAMLNVLERCFPEKMQSAEWQERMKELVPSYGQTLVEDEQLLNKVRERTLSTLNLV